MQHVLLSCGAFHGIKGERYTCYLAGILAYHDVTKFWSRHREHRMCDSKIKYCTWCNILTTQWTKGIATTLICNFPASATFYRHLPSDLFSKKRWCFGMSANFLFAIAHFQVGLVFWGLFFVLFFPSSSYPACCCFIFWGRGRVCQSRAWNVGKRVGRWFVSMAFRLVAHLSLFAAL